MRKESVQLDISAQESTKAYAVTDHIQSFSLIFTYETVTQEKEKTESQKKSNAATVNSWNSDELLTGENTYASLLPSSISIQLQLWNDAYTNTTPFAMTIPIVSNGFNALIVRKPKSTPPQSVSTPAAPVEQLSQNQPTLEIDSMKEILKNVPTSPTKPMHMARINSDAPKKRSKKRPFYSTLFAPPLFKRD
jgi:hypothetical protein